MDTQWVQDNSVGLLAIASGALNLFIAIAAVTKTKKDDTVSKWIKDVFKNFLSLK